MSYLITLAELEHLSEMELRSKYTWILSELARQQMALQECPLVLASIENIRTALRRRRQIQQGPKF